MNQLFDYKNFTFFAILNRDIRGSWGFTSYQDTDGNWYKAINGYDTKNVPRAWNVNFSPSELIYRVGKKQKVMVLINNEVKEMPLAEYVRKCSFCEGSPNHRGVSMFKEIDEEKDAGILIDAKRTRKLANDAAFELESKPKELAEIAQLIGEFRDAKDLQFAAVIQFADHDPRTFLEIAKSPDRKVRALIKKGLSTGELLEKGKLITWKNEVLGSDEDSAIQKLMQEPDMLKAVELAIKKNK